MQQKRSSSIIDKHSHIILLSCLSSNATPWVPDSDHVGSQSLLRRNVKVRARISKVLKVPEDFNKSKTIEFNVVQRKPADGIYADDYGIWSDINIDVKPTLLIFANRPLTQSPIEETLSNGAGLIVTIPDPSVPFAEHDVTRALEMESLVGQRNILESDQVRLLIQKECGNYGPIMANHIVESVSGMGPHDPATDKASGFLIDLIDNTNANVYFRKVVLAYLANQLAMTENPPNAHRIRFVLAMANILTEDKNDQIVNLLHEPICQAYLRNAIFDIDWKPSISVTDVFTDDSNRMTFEKAVQQGRFSQENKECLIKWIQDIE